MTRALARPGLGIIQSVNPKCPKSVDNRGQKFPMICKVMALLLIVMVDLNQISPLLKILAVFMTIVYIFKGNAYQFVILV